MEDNFTLMKHIEELENKIEMENNKKKLEKEKKKIYNFEYYKKKEKVFCLHCGLWVGSNWIDKHRQTKKHLKKIKESDTVDDTNNYIITL